MDEKTRHDLIFDIAFALGHKSPVKLKLDERDRAAVAAAVADHLKLANWKFERGEPLPPHRTP